MYGYDVLVCVGVGSSREVKHVRICRLRGGRRGGGGEEQVIALRKAEGAIAEGRRMWEGSAKAYVWAICSFDRYFALAVSVLMG